MIEYVEIRGSDTNIIGFVDIAKSIIWHSVYYGVGDFEIYTPETPAALDILKIGHYVTRPDNAEVGIIESINISGNEKTQDFVITRNIMTQPETVYNEEYGAKGKAIIGNKWGKKKKVLYDFLVQHNGAITDIQERTFGNYLI